MGPASVSNPLKKIHGAEHFNQFSDWISNDHYKILEKVEKVRQR